MTDIDHPYHIDGSGRTATAGFDDHVRDMVEQVLFTAPGERVNRPTFGSGLRQLVFEPNSPEIAAATRVQVEAALQQWLSDVLVVQAVEVQADDATVEVVVEYTVRRTGETRVERFAGVG